MFIPFAWSKEKTKLESKWKTGGEHERDTQKILSGRGGNWGGIAGSE
jgi:hypothetical protein